MKSFAFTMSIGAVVAVRPIEYKFVEHLAKFDKSYPDVVEFNQRLALFEAKDAWIEATNAVE